MRVRYLLHGDERIHHLGKFGRHVGENGHGERGGVRALALLNVLAVLLGMPLSLQVRHLVVHAMPTAVYVQRSERALYRLVEGRDVYVSLRVGAALNHLSNLRDGDVCGQFRYMGLYRLFLVMVFIKVIFSRNVIRWLSIGHIAVSKAKSSNSILYNRALSLAIL